MDDYMTTCSRCEGHGTIQHGSLAGNECSACIGGYVLTQDGETLALLIARFNSSM
jgi:DnaJ-class molecular chaperone